MANYLKKTTPIIPNKKLLNSKNIAKMPAKITPVKLGTK